MSKPEKQSKLSRYLSETRLLEEDVEDLLDIATDFIESGESTVMVLEIICNITSRFHKYTALQRDIQEMIMGNPLEGVDNNVKA